MRPQRCTEEERHTLRAPGPGSGNMKLQEFCSIPRGELSACRRRRFAFHEVTTAAPSPRETSNAYWTGAVPIICYPTPLLLSYNRPREAGIGFLKARAHRESAYSYRAGERACQSVRALCPIALNPPV